MFDKTIKDLEQYLLQNLSGVCFLLVSIFCGIGLDGKLDKEFALTAIGAIIVFWYGYKTYERDKEIEALINYTKEYKAAIHDISNKGIGELLNSWYTQYFLYKKGYLKADYWIELEYQIKKDLLDILLVEYDDFLNNKNQYLSEDYRKVIDYMNYSTTLSIFDSKKLTIANQFLPYLRQIIKEVVQSIKTLKENQSNNLNQWFDIYTN